MHTLFSVETFAWLKFSPVTGFSFLSFSTIYLKGDFSVTFTCSGLELVVDFLAGGLIVSNGNVLLHDNNSTTEDDD